MSLTPWAGVAPGLPLVSCSLSEPRPSSPDWPRRQGRPRTATEEMGRVCWLEMHAISAKEEKGCLVWMARSCCVRGETFFLCVRDTKETDQVSLDSFYFRPMSKQHLVPLNMQVKPFICPTQLTKGKNHLHHDTVKWIVLKMPFQHISYSRNLIQINSNRSKE